MEWTLEPDDGLVVIPAELGSQSKNRSVIFFEAEGIAE